MAKPAKDKELNTPEENQTQGFVYPVYDLWKLDVENLESDKDGNSKKVKLTAVKIERKNVKIENNVAEMLNAQSHNTRKKYYLQGSIENGAEETITIK
jgi:hypothetical protein